VTAVAIRTSDKQTLLAELLHIEETFRCVFWTKTTMLRESSQSVPDARPLERRLSDN
jgi:hypothetical protein